MSTTAVVVRGVIIGNLTSGCFGPTWGAQPGDIVTETQLTPQPWPTYPAWDDEVARLAALGFVKPQ
jgi:hypothetical protein